MKALLWVAGIAGVEDVTLFKARFVGSSSPAADAAAASAGVAGVAAADVLAVGSARSAAGWY